MDSFFCYFLYAWHMLRVKKRKLLIRQNLIMIPYLN